MRVVAIGLAWVAWSAWSFGARPQRSGGRAGGRAFPEAPAEKKVGVVRVAQSFALGRTLGAGGAVVATLSYCAWVHPPAHSWTTAAMCLAGMGSISLPSGLVAGLLTTREMVVSSGAVRDAVSRAWSSVVTEQGDTALADGIESALNASDIASGLVTDFVKGAGFLGAPARWIASAWMPWLDAALRRVELEVTDQYNRRALPGAVDRRRVEPVVASAAEGVVLRFIDDANFIIVLAALLLAFASDGAFLALDAILPR
mmetsp:Transcript_6465/g.19636  ORF Transcript_6465/g.19636 Transcript_6465/m.19636 type:complete len:257 (-) Transcript_6465:168-938(-)